MADQRPVGVLVMAYGTPERPEDLEAYYTDIRRGRPPTPALLYDLRRRYDAIGGLSPLAERTRAQASGLQAALDAAAPGAYAVALGCKHAAPSIEAGARQLQDLGVSHVVGLVLAPHHSALSTGQYHERAAAVLGDRFRPIGPWGTAPELIALLGARVRAALARLPEAGSARLVVTAHSLPQRAVELDDPSYPAQLEATARALAARTGLPAGRWQVAFQSAGRTPEPWLGPDLLEVLDSMAGGAATAVVVCPAGFTSDHLEVLYDIDIEARQRACEAGLELERTASLNDDPAFCALLARLVQEASPQP